jgi:hypothetical protein
MKPGIYETIYGNTALVSSDKSKKAWDLDAAENIPVDQCVKYIRPAKASDKPSPERRRQSMW